MTPLPSRRSPLLTATLMAIGILISASACGRGDDATTPTREPAQPPTQSSATTSRSSPAPSPTTSPTAAPATAAPCPANLIAFGTAQAANGSIAINLEFTVPTTGAPCTYAGPIKVTMLDSGGVPLLGMAENPATATVNGPAAAFTWRNWCAAPGTFRASVTAGNATTLIGIPGPPQCTAPRDKSTVTLVP